jgi:hypothetical protein
MSGEPEGVGGGSRHGLLARHLPGESRENKYILKGSDDGV